ncbi:MAG: hypothetical protein IJY13_04235, partial [Clostridia bacterium]|nr:hypothetical protein [Clostridia bacterium]
MDDILENSTRTLKKYKYGAKASKELQQFFTSNYKSTFVQQTQICIKKKSNQTDCSFFIFSY